MVVSQLHRSPGVCFESSVHLNGKLLHGFRIIPDRGSWLEVQFDTNDLLYVYLDRRRRRRKFLATTFLRAIGFATDEAIIKEFYKVEKLKLTAKADEEALSNKTVFVDILDGEIIIAKAYEPLTIGVVRQLMELGHKTIEVIDTREDDILIKSLKKDPAANEEEALKDIYRRLRPGDPPTVNNAKALLKRLFFDPKKYDLTRVGRYKINQKLGLDGEISADQRVLTSEDFLASMKYLLRLKQGEGILDDIDHLGSRRIRAVGELLANQCRVGLARTERLVKERMTLFDVNIEGMTPQKLVNPKALSAVVRDFFGRSQLSQFMDQINPLAELTHKRRLSALGPGGLNRDRAGFEVRDVHPSHYGRVCPIETPEGPNIGLINSMSTFARINEFGFIETPYRIITKGKVTGKIEYFTADQEEGYIIAQANNELDGKGNFVEEKITARSQGDFLEVDPTEAGLMDVSPKQLVSIAASLIPFLEHDDANRALMGSNMQRQGVPLLQAEAPLRRHRHGGESRPRFALGHRLRRQGRRRSRDRRVDRRHPRRPAADPGCEIPQRTGEAQEPARQGDPRLPAAQVHALQRRHLHQPAPARPQGRQGEGGHGARRWAVHRQGRTRARPQRARRVHAVERIQLRGRDHDLAARRQR